MLLPLIAYVCHVDAILRRHYDYSSPIIFIFYFDIIIYVLC